MSFDLQIYYCNNQNKRHFSPYRKFTSPLCNPSLPLPQSLRSVFCRYWLVCILQTFIQIESYRFSFVSFFHSVESLRFIHVFVLNTNFSNFFLAEQQSIECVYQNVFIPSPDDGNLGCFHVRDVTVNGVVNICL